MDVDHDGFLSKSEFRVFALVKFGIVSKDSLERIDYLFKKMDFNKDGKLTFEEVERYLETKPTDLTKFREFLVTRLHPTYKASTSKLITSIINELRVAEMSNDFVSEFTTNFIEETLRTPPKPPQSDALSA